MTSPLDLIQIETVYDLIMSEHGIMRPNPALLYDLEASRKLKSQPVIAHDLGAGQLCVKCGPKCPGFQLHFWR